MQPPAPPWAKKLSSRRDPMQQVRQTGTLSYSLFIWSTKFLTIRPTPLLHLLEELLLHPRQTEFVKGPMQKQLFPRQPTRAGVADSAQDKRVDLVCWHRSASVCDARIRPQGVTLSKPDRELAGAGDVPLTTTGFAIMNLVSEEKSIVEWV